jgi:hypothetical protein
LQPLIIKNDKVISMTKVQLAKLAHSFSDLQELSCLSFSWDASISSQFGGSIKKTLLIDNIESLLRESTLENVFRRPAITSSLDDFLMNYGKIISSFASTDYESFYYASYVYSALLLLSLSLSLQLQSDASEDLGDKIERIEDMSLPGLLFRGQSDSSWGMLPSMFRKVECVGDIDYQWIVKKFQDYSLISQYQSFFKDLDFNENAEEIFSFFQHTISYSPFLDFSTSIKVAGSFAASRIDKASRGKDGSILVLADPYPHEEIPFSNVIQKTKISLLGPKISIFSSIRGTPFYLSNRESLKPKFYFDRTPTNDKMWFQSGRLLYFYDCFILNGRILFPSNVRVDFENILIPSSKKQQLYERISKEPKYKQKFLNDPYRFFKDITKRPH